MTPEPPDAVPSTGSVKRTLFAWLLLPLLIIVPAGAALQYWFSARPAGAAFDHALGDTALALANLVRIEDGSGIHLPRIVPVRSSDTFKGDDWLGLRVRESSVVRGIGVLPVFAGLIGLLLLIGSLAAAWMREGR